MLRSGVITMVLKSIWSSSRPAVQVDSTVRNCIRRTICLLAHSSTRHWCRLPCLSRSAWRTMFGHIWLCTCVELRGCRKRAAAVAITDGAGCEHEWNDVGLGRSAPVRGAPLHRRRGVRCCCILHSFRVRRHKSSEVHHSYSIICTPLWMSLRKTIVTIVLLYGLALRSST